MSIATETNLGVQDEGMSSSSVKLMALNAFKQANLGIDLDVADVGAGRGELTNLLLPFSKSVTMIDFYEPSIQDEKVKFVKVDLNDRWCIPDNRFDVVFSLEVIEHVENPRHFVREIRRILKPNGYGFISTPNNLNFFSKLNFLFKNEHRFFQDFCYPAHITCLFKKDVERILAENDLVLKTIVYNYHDVLPFFGKDIHLKSEKFSNSIGFLFYKS